MNRWLVLAAVSAISWAVCAATPWTGKKVVFLGDSITTERQWIDLKQRIYWQYLAEDLGLEPHVYAVSGYQWDRVYKAAQKMKDEMGGDVDAILIFAGTNDYMNGIPLGEWYDVAVEEVYLKGKTLKLPRRHLIKDMKTFKGRINTVMDFLKTNFPDQQIVIMTPIHRGLARLSGTNVQPEESFPNALGNYFDEYIVALREAADIWSVPVIDLYRESGLYPMNAAYAKCFRRGGPVSEKNPDPDNLHPNTEGHRRLAKTIAARLMTLPTDFKCSISKKGKMAYSEDCSIPVHQGCTAKGIPFWNDHAVFFRYAPAFKFKPVAGALRYRFTLMRADATNRVPSASFLADSPEAPLSPVWNGLSNARWTVFCEGMDSNGKSLGSSGERTFVKTAAFTGGHAGAKRPYREAARMIYEYMTALPAMKTLVETGRPDQNYQHNAYPSKTHAAHVMAMLDWAASDPANGEKARRFARASGEYLLSQLERPDAPLAYWPPTYGRKPLECDQNGNGGKKRHAMVGNDPEGAAKYRGQVMSLYPADVGVAFLALYKAMGDGRYIEAAEGIGETYLKIRRSDGTWALKYWLATGEVQCGNNLVPTRPMALFEKLAEVTGDVKWRNAAEDCFVWLEKGPLSDWNWDGQFEDIEPRPPYQDLTKHNAIETMFYLLKLRRGDPSTIAKARDILRWSEDQFVFWEPPCGLDDELESPGGKNKMFYPGRWHYPSVYEQYSCYISIDASASKMIAAYLAMYRADGDPLDLEKAKALADAITQVQEPSGRVPTFWSAGSKAGWLAEERYDWLNCMASCAKALMDVADVVGHKRSY